MCLQGSSVSSQSMQVHLGIHPVSSTVYCLSPMWTRNNDLYSYSGDYLNIYKIDTSCYLKSICCHLCYSSQIHFSSISQVGNAMPHKPVWPTIQVFRHFAT